HLEMKPIEQDVEWSGFEIKVVGTSAKFGLSLPAVKVFEDNNNDGVGDTLFATLTVEHEGSDFVVFKPQDAPTILKKGIKTSLVVEVDMQLYSGQYAKFTISDVDTNAKVIGGTIVSDVFKYDCTKEDDGCRLAPGDEVEAASGCSVLSIF
ncbi:hypothetical protein KAH37_10125, partial [bacterium]|nr:hypothetical protein [bacterium]